MIRPVLFGLSSSAYTRIVRLTLEEKGIDYDFEKVDVFDKKGVSSDHLLRHPFGRIPAFSDGDFNLYETSAITRYIDEAYSGPSLQPSALKLKARMSQFISLLDSYAYRSMIWPIFVERVSIPLSGGVANEVAIKQALPTAKLCLNAMASLIDGRSFLAGSQLTLADLHALPMLLYFSQTPEGNKMLGRQPNLSRWLDAMKQRKSVSMILSSVGYSD